MEPEITDKERALAELLMKRAVPGATVEEFVGLLRAWRAEKEAQGDETAQLHILC